MNIDDALATIRNNSSVARGVGAHLNQASHHLSQAIYALMQAQHVADKDRVAPIGNVTKAVQAVQRAVDEMRNNETP